MSARPGLGVERLTVDATVGGVALASVPVGAVYALARVKTNTICFTDDGTAPTTTVGMEAEAGDIIVLATPAKFKAIKRDAGNATLIVNYYGPGDGISPLVIQGSSSATISGALPAGDNNIGNVDVVTLPALVAGTANIGDVDVATLPGTVAADITASKTALEILDNVVAGSEAQVDIVASLPAGANNIGDVDVLTLPAVYTEAAVDASIDGIPVLWEDTGDTLRVASAAKPLPVNQIPLDVTTDDVLAYLGARASGGSTPYSLISAATTNATSVKAAAGQVYWINCTNINAAVRYLKLYNKASAPTVGADTPVLRFAIPANAAGAGFVLPSDVGIVFSTGIAFALTTGYADADTGAVALGDILVNIGYA